MFKATCIAGLGGFIGTVMRFLSEKLGAWISNGAPFPVGTFIANICGAFLIGLFYGWVAKRNFMTKSLNLLLITGLCGGFTTFSSFSDEMVGLLQKGDCATFWWYLALSIVLGITMVWLGIACVSKQPTKSVNA